MKNGYYKYNKDGKTYLFLIYDNQFYFPKEIQLMRSMKMNPREFYIWVDGLPEYKRKEKSK